MNIIPSFTLNTGQRLPAVGIGCWMGRVGEGDHVYRMVRDALEVGYRHIDTAANYGNEESVGRAIRDSGIPRNELFVVTKLSSEDHANVNSALDRSLIKLGLTYVDVYLMHWPQAIDAAGKALQPDESPTLSETWADMEKLVTKGKTNSIGVSNFSIKTLSHLLSSSPPPNITPSINQVESHPNLPQHALLAYCRSRGIHVTAYAPVAKGRLGEEEVVKGVAAAANERRMKAGEEGGVGSVEEGGQLAVTGAQVLLSWGVQRGTSVIPKSVKRERLKENIQLVGLIPEEMRQFDELHLFSSSASFNATTTHKTMHHSVCGFHSSDLGGSCFGWTYQQLGWDMGPEPGVMRH